MAEIEVSMADKEYYFEVDPCPFCGKDLGEFDENVGIVGLTHTVWVECQDCSARGSRAMSYQEAADKWNNRAK